MQISGMGRIPSEGESRGPELNYGVGRESTLPIGYRRQAKQFGIEKRLLVDSRRRLADSETIVHAISDGWRDF